MAITMDKTSFQLFRLREGSQIVGYMRFLKPGQPYFSKDRFWWNASSIQYLEKDSFAEFNDINQQPIFEFDIVEMKSLKDLHETYRAIIIYDDERGDFVAVRCDSYLPILKKDWKDFKFTLFSYLFINPEIEEELKLRRWV